MADLNMAASPQMQEYFARFTKDCLSAYNLAKEARKLGYDPEQDVGVTLARTLAERVIGLISVIASQIKGVGVEQRIEELEKQYGVLDWRVSFVIAHEIAQQRFCRFETEIEAITTGVRVGFAYHTLGVVSAPLEGLTSIEICDRRDRQGKYFRLNFAGPIRNAGGTAAAVCVLIADYVRVKMGYSTYDPTEEEILRCPAELADYHERVTNLQYFPSEEESIFLMRHLPVEISGDPSEKFEVSNIKLKDLPRIPTNQLRSGYCLIHSSCIPLKAPKLWKQLEKWGDKMDMGHWNFMKEFLDVQKKMKAAGKKASSAAKITPDYTYIKDLVAGRPVLSYPLRPGGFRLRYGRSRASGYSGQAIHPCTMIILDDFIASATQCKVERPGKAAAFMPCDTLEGPIVLLKDKSVIQLQDEVLARNIRDHVERILYLGDVLINYGDFYNRNHSLVPVGYCPEWWVQDVEQAVREKGLAWGPAALSGLTGIKEFRCAALINDPLRDFPTAKEAAAIATGTGTPLHPRWTYYWTQIGPQELKTLLEDMRSADRLSVLNSPASKAALEMLGIPHQVERDAIILSREDAFILRLIFSTAPEDAITIMERRIAEGTTDTLMLVNAISPVRLRDKAGTFIGARMGRPEKAKMRKLTGSPHTLFPVGEEGGRLRSIQEALVRGKITAEFPIRYCAACKLETIFGRCEICDGPTEQRTREVVRYNKRPEDPPELSTCGRKEIDIRRIFDACLKKLEFRIWPDLIKGVRGTSNRSHIPEHLIKGILRAKHDICVNKDGTTRYDCSEVTLTHFKPAEAGVSVEALIGLGYTHDCRGEPLTRPDQVLELKPQDILIPCCPASPDEPADEVLWRTANFIDEMLVRLYGLPPYYNLKSKEDLVGHYVVGLAPHTSAGIVGRIVGFSQTQGFLAHPLYHAAMRRDCFTADTYLPLKKDGRWGMERIGDVVEALNPTKKVDAHGTLEARPKGYATLGLVDGKIAEVPVNAFTKHTPMPIIRIVTRLGKELRTTANHKHVVLRNNEEIIVPADRLEKGDVLKLPYVLQAEFQDVKEIDLLEELASEEWVMVRGLKALVPDLKAALRSHGATFGAAANYAARDSVPIAFAKKMMREHNIPHDRIRLAAKRDTVTMPAVIKVTDALLECIGLYVAEGFARNQKGVKGSYQVYIAAEKQEIRRHVQETFAVLGIAPTERKTDRVTYSSRVLYALFTQVLCAGANAYEKRIPKRFLMLPPKRLGRLLSGYFEGDGSVSENDLRIVFDTVSKGLIHDMEFLLGRMGVFLKLCTSTRQPGKKVREFYDRKGREVPFFTCTRGIIQSRFVHALSRHVRFLSEEKRYRQDRMLQKRFRNLFCQYDATFFYDEILALEIQDPEPSYCLNVKNHHVIANGILTKQCDGDESCFVLLMDAFLNFSPKFLAESRGSTMDAPLVITYLLNPAEVDDMAFHVDRAWRYPREMYEAALEYRKPYDIKIDLIGDVLGKPEQFEGMGYTHEITSINAGVLCSAYKTLPSMEEKLGGQMALARKIRACDESDVARLVIEKHFIRDIKGNLRKFTQQEYRCVKCNEKFRRPPLIGRCIACAGKIVFTISEGSVIKYLEPSLSIAKRFNVPTYLQHDLELLHRKIEDLFGKDKETQLGLGKWFG